jgi:hypothetical protein
VTGSRRDAGDESVFALLHVHIKALGFDRQRRLDLRRAQRTFSLRRLELGPATTLQELTAS